MAAVLKCKKCFGNVIDGVCQSCHNICDSDGVPVAIFKPTEDNKEIDMSDYVGVDEAERESLRGLADQLNAVHVQPSDSANSVTSNNIITKGTEDRMPEIERALDTDTLLRKIYSLVKDTLEADTSISDDNTVPCKKTCRYIERIDAISKLYDYARDIPNILTKLREDNSRQMKEVGYTNKVGVGIITLSGMTKDGQFLAISYSNIHCKMIFCEPCYNLNVGLMNTLARIESRLK